MSEERLKLFDEWAETYDRSVSDCEGFPFEGYEEVLDTIATVADAHEGLCVLDLGVGTGRLAERFLRLSCSVCGLDFSVKMLARAHARFPDMELIKADLLGDWPIDRDRCFDRIVSGYLLHEFDLDSKVRLITRLVTEHLGPGGKMVVGDISFETAAAREEARRWWSRGAGGGMDDPEGGEGLWDEDEHYWAADEARAALTDVGLSTDYEQVSFCGGVYAISSSGTHS